MGRRRTPSTGRKLRSWLVRPPGGAQGSQSSPERVSVNAHSCVRQARHLSIGWSEWPTWRAFESRRWGQLDLLAYQCNIAAAAQCWVYSRHYCFIAVRKTVPMCPFELITCVGFQLVYFPLAKCDRSLDDRGPWLGHFGAHLHIPPTRRKKKGNRNRRMWGDRPLELNAASPKDSRRRFVTSESGR